MNLLAVAHYIEALDVQREFIRIQAVLGGKNPHPQTYLVGGMATAMDGNEPGAALNPATVTLLTQLVKNAKTFVEQVYLPDVVAIAGFYKEWFAYGQGIGNYMAYGDYTLGSINDSGGFLFPRGMILGRDLSTVHPVDTAHVTEYVTHSWYTYAEGNGVGKHPSQGETSPRYTGPAPPFAFLNTAEKYSWIKSPRYDGRAMEVGPLSRTLIAYASGSERVKKLVDGTLAKLNLPLTALFSTMGRIAARALEAEIMVGYLDQWIAKLNDNMAQGNLRMHNGDKWDPDSWPRSCQGFGLHEAPRGSLGHWIEIENKKIANYQAVVPSTWNAGPRDGEGQRGAYEA